MNTELTDNTKKFLKRNFNEDGTQNCIFPLNWNGGGSAGRARKLADKGVLEHVETNQEQRFVTYKVAPDYLSVLTEADPVTLSDAQVKILDKLESHNQVCDGRPAGLSTRELGYYGSEHYCGVGEQSVRSNLKKLEKLGLVKPSRSGRATYYRRTIIERPESVEERKARLAAEKEAAERRAGKIATCQGCLRGICLHDGQDQERRRMVRHGWEFISTGGHYGWHNGECLGTAEKPLEDDYKVALKCMQMIMDKIAFVQSTLTRLLGRPDFINVEKNEWNSETRRSETKFIAEPRNDKDMEKDRVSYYNEYETGLRSRIRRERQALRSLGRDLASFSAAVSAIWDNKDTAAVFMKSDPLIREARETAEAEGYAWTVAEAA